MQKPELWRSQDGGSSGGMNVSECAEWVGLVGMRKKCARNWALNRVVPCRRAPERNAEYDISVIYLCKGKILSDPQLGRCTGDKARVTPKVEYFGLGPIKDGPLPCCHCMFERTGQSMLKVECFFRHGSSYRPIQRFGRHIMDEPR